MEAMLHTLRRLEQIGILSHGLLSLVPILFSLVLDFDHEPHLWELAQFSGFAAVADERIWSLIMGGCGAIGILGLTARTKWAETASIIVLSICHIVMAKCFWSGAASYGEYVTPAVTTYGLLAVYGFCVAALRVL